jgi:hypothetical protein
MEHKPSRLADVINYKPDSYLTEEDIALIRDTFRNNERLIRVLRKIFLPSVGDNALPLEELGKDMWLNMDFAQMANDEIKPIVLARQDAIKFIMGALIQLKVIANTDLESPLNAELKKQKDSTK